MAIYHMSAQVIGRSAGRSATAAAAYRAGEKIADERTGEVHDYTRKGGVDYAEILTPTHAGEWARDRARLWNTAEQSEKRINSQIAREINIALPRELTPEQNRELVREYAQRNFVNQGMIADLCIHHENGENPHAHIMLSMREAGPEGFTEKNRSWNDKEQLEKWRENWAHSCNKSMERAGVNFQIDHRKLEAQGVERAPTQHLGPSAAGMERRGESSERGDYNRDIVELDKLTKSLAEVTKELKAIRREQDIQEKSLSATCEVAKKEEAKPQSIAEFISKPQEKKQTTTEQKTSIANVINQSQKKTQEQVSFEKMLVVIKSGNRGQAEFLINQLRKNAQEKNPKIVVESKPEYKTYKQNILLAQKNLENTQRQEGAIVFEKEQLGMFGKLQYKAGKHELNTAEIAAHKAKEKANQELAKSRREFDEYLFRETSPGGTTFKECQEHNQSVVPKAKEALPIAEKAYLERIKEEQNRERERMRGKVREPERGRDR